MSWHHQLEAVLCAILLLASILAVAIRPLVVGIAGVEVNIGLSTDQVPKPRANPLNTMSKAPPIIIPRPSQSPLEMNPGDEGSLWDEGPAYDFRKTGRIISAGALPFLCPAPRSGLISSLREDDG
jgi:hypothetical protein